jgi:hypothetical protein
LTFDDWKAQKQAGHLFLHLAMFTLSAKASGESCCFAL